MTTVGGCGPEPNVVAERTIRAEREAVYAWLEDSRNYARSPMVLACPWRRPGTGSRFGADAVRDVYMAAGWYREQITGTVPGRQIDYRVLRSVPPVRQDYSRIILTDRPGGDGPLTHARWEAEVHVLAPLIGGAATRLSAPVASALYGTILGAAERALTVR